MDHLDQHIPPNWPTGVDLDRVAEVIYEDGIPLVWIPRATLVDQVLAASDRTTRLDLLLHHSNEVIKDCRHVLNEVSEPVLAGQLPLVHRAAVALAAGHTEAAQALAVVTAETVIARTLGNYTQAKEMASLPKQVPWCNMKLKVTLAPIDRFYAPWWPGGKTPVPQELSRHVSVHQADVNHYSPSNGLVAVMLLTSLLRTLQDWIPENQATIDLSQQQA
jgi:hypothetical protein